MTYQQLDSLEKKLLSMEAEMVSLRNIILQEKHQLQGPKRAGLYPGQYDNYVEPEVEECVE